MNNLRFALANVRINQIQPKDARTHWIANNNNQRMALATMVVCVYVQHDVAAKVAGLSQTAHNGNGNDTEPFVPHDAS